jgi:spore germination protein KA
MKAKTIQDLLNKKIQKQTAFHSPQQTDRQEQNGKTTPLSKDISENICVIKGRTGNSSDILIREFPFGKDLDIRMAVAYTNGMSDKAFIQEFILETLMIDVRKELLDEAIIISKEPYDVIKDHALPIGNITEVSHVEDLLLHLVSGDSIIMVDGYDKCIVASSKGWADRGVPEATAQTVVRGPKEGFSETLGINTSLIRRRIKDPNLWIETKKIGKRTKTDVAIVYLKDLVSDDLINEVHKRLDQINVDSILESGYIEELVQDDTFTPFPTVFNTERPDSVASSILEGRVAIMVDGTPFVLIVPALFVHFFQSSEDYYQRADISIAIRVLRYIAFFLALLTPSLYIAITTFHQEMLPPALLVSLAAQREGVPFPAIVEAFLMELTFEILREAGIRMPRVVGPAISIVGALVLGQAAVEAGIVSSSMVIVVALTAISSFVSPAFNLSITVRLLRFAFMILAGTFGLFGIILGLITLILHATSLRSFGIPYMAPFAPFIWQDQRDAILRFPRWGLKLRPKLMNQKDKTRAQTPAPQPDNDTSDTNS